MEVMIFFKRRVQKGFDEEAASRKAARSHFRDWIDYCGVAFLQEFTGIGRTFSGFSGPENSGM